MEELRTNDYLKGIVSNLPESPGIYQYLNTEGTIIYVGKAKNLKRRVSSYFNREHEPGKTRVLVSKIADIRYIVVNTEEDALLLWPLQPYTFHVRITRPHQASVPFAYMPPEPLSGKHTCRKVQCLPGIPHQELCRTLHREAKPGRVSEKHR